MGLVDSEMLINPLAWGSDWKSIDKTKSKKQVAYLLSKGSPLTSAQKKRLLRELHSGKVKVKK